MTTRLAAIKSYLEGAAHDTPIELPADWVRQLVDVAEAAEPLSDPDRCPSWPAKVCSDNPPEWESCDVCRLHEALVRLAWAEMEDEAS